MENIKFDEYKRRLENYRNERDLEFNEFLIDYSERNPPPEPRKDIVEKEVKLSLKFWLSIVAGVCAVGASGLRVYDRIFQVAINSGASYTLATLESIFAIGAVNICLVAMSFVFAYQKRKVSQTSLLVGLIVSATISLVAGLGQSFYGLKMVEITGGFDWILAISLSAITALEFTSGDMAGVEMVNYEIEKENAIKEFNKRKEDENKRYDVEYKTWLSNARKNIGNWKLQFMAWNEKNYSESNVKESEMPKTDIADNTLTKSEQSDFSNLSKGQQAYALIEKFVKTKKRIPSTKEISEKGYAIGTVSVARNKFIVENKEKLLKENIITPEILVKSKQSYEKINA